MKPSEKKLGLAIQLFLIQQGLQIEDLAQQMGITSDALSNLIHGRRGFKNETLERLARTPALQAGGLTLTKLRALRAMDEYRLEELILAMVEYIKLGEIERLPKDFFQQLQKSLEQDGFPHALSDKKHALLALIQEDPA
ncbi:MAG TPA: helix-turn-helix transcriptional regulator [Oculatellaceae cyanobacterium]|jgi:transcriptional regulator with XRE-family HTH domain